MVRLVLVSCFWFLGRYFGHMKVDGGVDGCIKMVFYGDLFVYACVFA
jgi:hypothetical protein